nr:immunoglobulin heavy chain junction region [Mus musculus]
CARNTGALYYFDYW